MGRINLYLFNAEIYMTTVLPYSAMRFPKTRLIILQQHHYTQSCGHLPWFN